MKTKLKIVALFFAFLVSASAQTTTSYGLLPVKKAEGAQVSSDERCVWYNGNLYYDTSSTRWDLIQPALFVKGVGILNAEVSEDNEYLYYNSKGYQIFRTDWKPTEGAKVQMGASPQTLLGFTILMILFIGWFARATAHRRPW